MPGRAPRVNQVKTAFLSKITASQNLVNTIIPFSTHGLHPQYVRQVVELAFMSIISDWEEFLEMTLVRYLCGACTSSNFAPTPKYGLANKISHAYQILANNPKHNAGKDYIKVSDPIWVNSLADFYFHNHSFGCVKTYSQLIVEAQHIRNRVAHSSEKCRIAFKKTALWFNPGRSTLRQGYTPGDLLQAQAMRHFPTHLLAQSTTHFQAYADLFRQLANQVVP